MARQVAVLVTHGIGSYAHDFGDPNKRFDRRLREGVAKALGADMRDVVWQAALWSDGALETRQQDLLDENDKDFFLLGDVLSKFLIEAMSDASSYQFFGVEDDRFPDSNYLNANQLFYLALKELEGRLQDPSNTPLVLVAQSMGCHVVSSYQWDAQRDHRRILGRHTRDTITPFARLDTLASAFFTGCNMPILTMGTPRDRKVPMQVPGPRLRAMNEERKARGAPPFETRWRNYYDPDDVLGFGLEKEYEAYFAGAHPVFGPGHPQREPDKDVAPEDIEFETRWPGGLTPYSHVLYWRSRTVQQAVAETVRGLMGV